MATRRATLSGDPDAGIAGDDLRSSAEFVEVHGSDFVARLRDFNGWYAARLDHASWPYNRTLASSPGTTARVVWEHGQHDQGINFASQDYLSLASHPRVVEAGIAAAREHGIHSAGSAILTGNTTVSRALEEMLGTLLGHPHALLFPTGWAAGYGVLRGLAQTGDVVLLDALAHNCLQEGARASQAQVRLFRHNSLDHLGRLLARSRARHPAAALFVVTEGLFSMDSDTPDLRGMADLVHAHGGILVVDIAHDLGVLGPTGRSALETAGALGAADLVMGAFSKVFASNGGFVVCRHEAVIRYLRVYGASHVFSNALSAVQAAAILEAIRIAFSDEGVARRAQLLARVSKLRDILARGGLGLLGSASPIVPCMIGSEATARRAAALCANRGVIVNLAEFPAVARSRARLRLQVQADHSEAQIAAGGAAILAAVREAAT